MWVKVCATAGYGCLGGAMAYAALEQYSIAAWLLVAMILFYAAVVMEVEDE